MTTDIPLEIGQRVWHFGMDIAEYRRQCLYIMSWDQPDDTGEVWTFHLGLRCPFSGRTWHIRPPQGAPCPCGYRFVYRPPDGGGGKWGLIRRERVLTALQTELPNRPVSHRRIMEAL